MKSIVGMLLEGVLLYTDNPLRCRALLVCKKRALDKTTHLAHVEPTTGGAERGEKRDEVEVALNRRPATRFDAAANDLQLQWCGTTHFNPTPAHSARMRSESHCIVDCSPTLITFPSRRISPAFKVTRSPLPGYIFNLPHVCI
jgi:hypothetical protein